MEELERRVTCLEVKVDQLIAGVAELKGQAANNGTLIKFVILPLLVIVGGLVGIKIV